MSEFLNHLETEIYSDLWHNLVTETGGYPWYPETGENYYEQLDSESPLAEYLDSELSSQSSVDFFARLEQLYPTTVLDRVKEILTRQFGHQVPMLWLEAIVQRLPETLSPSVSPLERLVNCVQPLLTNWCVEDLEVFARPLVYEFRDGRCNQSSLLNKQWSSLSEVEKARLTLIIAETALENWQQ